MTDFGHDGFKPANRDEAKHYPSLKKSLSAPFTISPGAPSEDVGNPTNGSRLVPATAQGRSPNNPQLSVNIPKPRAAAEFALAALHYLPTPLLVLSSMKSVILANEAMGRLLGLTDASANHGVEDGVDSNEEKPVLDRLVGRSLTDIGIHIIQNGQRIWVGWEVSIILARWI